MKIFERSYSFKTIFGLKFGIQHSDFRNSDLEYDKNRNLIRETNYLAFSQDQVGFVNEYIYNNKNELIEERLLSNKGVVSELTKYYYVDKLPEELINIEKSDYEIKHTYYLIKNGIKIKALDFWQNGERVETGDETNFVYDINNCLIEKRNSFEKYTYKYDSNQKLIELHKNENYKEELIYNSYGLCNKIIYQDSQIIKELFNEKGDLIESKTYIDNLVQENKRLIYKYDDLERIIQITHFLNGKPFYLLKRLIENN